MKLERYSLPLLYFAIYAAISSVLPFLSLYYQASGLSGTEIGIFLALNPLAALCLAPFWGDLADRKGLHRPLLLIGVTMSSIATVDIALEHSFLLFSFGVLLFASASAGIIPLLDSMTLHRLQTHMQDYGLVRRWGSLGSGIFVLTIGVLSLFKGIIVIFASYVLCMSIGAAIIVRLSPISSNPPREALPFRQGLRSLLACPPFHRLLAVLIFVGVSVGASEAFFGILITDVGGNSFYVGLAFALQAFVEISAMGLTRRVLDRTTSRRLFAVSFGVLTFLLALAGFAPYLLVVLCLQPLWGLAWAGYWTGATIEIAKLAPVSLQALGQALASAATLGLGSILGSLLGGWLLQTVGSITLYQINAGIALLGIAVFLCLEWFTHGTGEKVHNIFG